MFHSTQNKSIIYFWFLVAILPLVGCKMGNVGFLGSHYESPGVPVTLSIIAPLSIEQYRCVEVKGQLVDSIGKVSATSVDVNVWLKVFGQNEVLFYETGLCQAPISQVVIPGGQEGFSVYVLSRVLGTAALHFSPEVPTIAGSHHQVSVLADSSPRLAFTFPSGNIIAGHCVPVSIRAMDSNGKAFGTREDTPVKIMSTSGRFFTDLGCQMELMNSSVHFPAYTHQAVVFFRATVPSTLKLIATAPGFISGSILGTVVAAAPKRIALGSVPQTVRAGECSGPVNLMLKDEFSNPATTTMDRSLELSEVGDSLTQFFGPGDKLCSAEIKSVTVNVNRSGTYFYFKAQRAGLTKITASGVELLGATATLGVLDPAGRPDTIQLIANRNLTPQVGDCVGLKILSLDGLGQPKEVQPSAIKFDLASSPSGAFYSDDICHQPTSTIVIPKGDVRTTFFFRGFRAETTTVMATESEVANALSFSLALNLLSGPPAKLRFLDVPSQVTKTVCSGPIFIQALDAFDNVATPTKEILVALHATQGGSIFEDPSCSVSLASVVLTEDGNSVESIYFKGDKVGFMNLIGVVSELVAAAFSTVEVLNPPPLKLSVDINPEVIAGQCVDLIVTTKDVDDDTPAVFEPVSVLLSSTSRNPQLFFRDNTCTQGLTAVEIDADTNPTIIYFRDTVAEAIQISASTQMAGVASYAQTLRVKPAAPNKLVFDLAGTSTLIKDTCTGPFGVVVQDMFGNPSSVKSQLPIVFTNTGSALTAFSDSRCTNQTVKLAANDDRVIVYVRGSATGISNLYGLVEGLLAASRTWGTLNPSAQIISIVPSQGVLVGGTHFTIQGSEFLKDVTVKVGGLECTGLKLESSTRIHCFTPSGKAGYTDVVVTNPSSLPNTIANGFQYIDAPVVTSVFPDGGSIDGGTSIKISGANFSVGAKVMVGLSQCSNVTVTDPTTMQCVTPAGVSGAVTVSVTGANGLSGSLHDAFRYYGPPVLTGITPAIGRLLGRTLIVGSGNSFATGGTITVGGVDCTEAIISPTLFSCRTGAHEAGVVDVVFKNPDGKSGQLVGAFKYDPNVLNNPPVLEPIADQTMIVNTTRIIDLVAVDLDGDKLSFSAKIEDIAVALDNSYHFELDKNCGETYCFNAHGLNEKWFHGDVLGNNGGWFSILQSGNVYAYSGTPGTAAVRMDQALGTVDPKYYTDPKLLLNASIQPPPTPVVSLNAATLSIVSGVLGSFVVTVSASDGADSTVKKFNLKVSGAQ